MTPRRQKGEGSVYQRHDHPTCPPLAPDRTRPAHRCRGRWAAEVEDGYDRNGKRKRRVVTATTRRAVVDKLNRIKAEQKAGVTGDATTVEQWVNDWHATTQRDLAPRTWHVYRGYLDRYVIPHVGRHRLDALRAHHVQSMIRDMDREGLSAATQRQAYAVLRRALQVAVDEQRVMENVAARIKRPKADRAARHEALTVTQARQLLEHAPSSIDRARWMLALVVGLRQGEALGLRWEDVHLDEHPPWLRIHQQAQRIPGQGVVIRAHTKTEKPRIIPLTDALAPVADVLRQHRHENGGTGYVFGGPRPVSPRFDWGLWREALAAAGLPKVPLHGARATAEQWMDEAGVPLQTRSDVLGHATSQITQTVYHRATLETMTAGLAKSKALD